MNGVCERTFVDKSLSKGDVSFSPLRLSLLLSCNSSNIKAYDISTVDNLREKLFGDANRRAAGIVNIELGGPSIQCVLGKNNNIVFGVALKSRFGANWGNVDSRLLSEIGEINKIQKDYPYIISERNRIWMDATSFSEFTSSISVNMWNSEQKVIFGDVHVSLLGSMGNSSIQIYNLSGNIDINKDNISFLTESSGSIFLESSKGLEGNPRIANWFRPGKLTFGLGLGINYISIHPHEKYRRFKLRLAVKDIGRLKYNASTSLTGDYDINISNEEGLYFNENFKNSSFAATAKVFDSHPKLFEKRDSVITDYSVHLPSVAIATIYQRMNEKFAFGGVANVPLRRKMTRNMATLKVFQVYPEYIYKNLSIKVPILFIEYSGINCGINFSYREFWMGTQNILSFIRPSKSVSLQAGMSFTLN